VHCRFQKFPWDTELRFWDEEDEDEGEDEDEDEGKDDYEHGHEHEHEDENEEYQFHWKIINALRELVDKQGEDTIIKWLTESWIY